MTLEFLSGHNKGAGAGDFIDLSVFYLDPFCRKSSCYGRITGVAN